MGRASSVVGVWQVGREAGKERGSERGAEIPSSSWLSPCQYSRFFGGLLGTAAQNGHQKTARLVVQQIFSRCAAILRFAFITALKAQGGAKLKAAAFLLPRKYTSKKKAASCFLCSLVCCYAETLRPGHHRYVTS